MKTIKILGLVMLVLLGGFMVVFGEADDSPGLQGLGVIAAVAGVTLICKRVLKK